MFWRAVFGVGFCYGSHGGGDGGWVVLVVALVWGPRAAGMKTPERTVSATWAVGSRDRRCCWDSASVRVPWAGRAVHVPALAR